MTSKLALWRKLCGMMEESELWTDKPGRKIMVDAATRIGEGEDPFRFCSNCGCETVTDAEGQCIHCSGLYTITLFGLPNIPNKENKHGHVL